MYFCLIYVFCSKADYHRKRYRDDDHHYESSKRHADHESRKNSDHDSRPVISDDSSLFPHHCSFLLSIFLPIIPPVLRNYLPMLNLIWSNRKRIQDFGRVVTLMMKRKMNESDNLSKIDFELANKL